MMAVLPLAMTRPSLGPENAENSFQVPSGTLSIASRISGVNAYFNVSARTS